MDIADEVFSSPAEVIEKKKRGKKVQEEQEEVSIISISDLAPVSEFNLSTIDFESTEEDLDDVVVVDEELEKFREEVRNKINEIQNTYWFLGEALTRISKDKLFKSWGHKTFNEYIERECNHAKSSVYSLMKTYDYFHTQIKEKLSTKPEAYPVLIDAAKLVGWAKSSKVAQEQVVTTENYKEVIESMKTMTVSQLDAHLKEIRSQLSPEEASDAIEDNDLKTVKKSFALTLFQKEVVERAIEKAKGILREGASDSKAISMICGEFDSDHESSGESSVAEFASKIERTTDYNVILVSKNYDKILYGTETMAKLAEEPNATEN